MSLFVVLCLRESLELWGIYRAEATHSQHRAISITVVRPIIRLYRHLVLLFDICRWDLKFMWRLNGGEECLLSIRLKTLTHITHVHFVSINLLLENWLEIWVKSCILFWLCFGVLVLVCLENVLVDWLVKETLYAENVCHWTFIVWLTCIKIFKLLIGLIVKHLI